MLKYSTKQIWETKKQYLSPFYLKTDSLLEPNIEDHLCLLRIPPHISVIQLHSLTSKQHVHAADTSPSSPREEEKEEQG